MSFFSLKFLGIYCDYLVPYFFNFVQGNNVLGLPRWFSGKESNCQAGEVGLIPELGRSPAEGNGNPLQYSCLENPMDTGAWQSMGHKRVWHNSATKEQQQQYYCLIWSPYSNLSIVPILSFVATFSFLRQDPPSPGSWIASVVMTLHLPSSEQSLGPGLSWGWRVWRT